MNPLSKVRRTGHRRFPVAMVAALLFGGCANNAVVFTTATRTGIELNTTEPGQQGAHVGYERIEGVIMPLVATNTDGRVIYLKDAYPVYSKHYFHVGGLLAKRDGINVSGVIVKQSFATGQAALKPDVRNNVDQTFKILKGIIPNVEAHNKGEQLIGFLKNADSPNFNAWIITTANKAFGVTNLTSINDVLRSVQTAARKGDQGPIDYLIVQLRINIH